VFVFVFVLVASVCGEKEIGEGAVAPGVNGAADAERDFDFLDGTGVVMDAGAGDILDDDSDDNDNEEEVEEEEEATAKLNDDDAFVFAFAFR